MIPCKVGGRPGRLALVLDAEAALDRLYGGFYSDWSCGGQWNHMLEFVSVFFQSLQQANIHVAAFIDGTCDPNRKQEWIAGQLKIKQNVKQVLRHIGKRGTPPPKVWWIAPTGLHSVLRLGLRYLAVPIMASLDQHCLEVVHFLRENGYHGLLGDSSDYCIFDPPKYYSARKLKLTLKFTVETQMINMDEVAKAFDLNPNRLPLTAALLGGPVLTCEELQEFHARLIPGKEAPNKTDCGVLIKAVVNYVRTLLTVDNVEVLGEEIFGSASDPRVRKLVEVVAYYDSGTAEGYKKARLGKKRAKEGAAVTALASDTKEADLESKDWYDIVTQGRKSSATINGQSEEVVEQMGSLSLREKAKETLPKQDLVTDSQEAVAAVASNTAKASEDGKYPKKDSKTEKIPHLPPVNGEVLRTAAERHRQGQMVPALHQLLTTGELLFPVLLEEQGEGGASRMAGGIHLVYRCVSFKTYLNIPYYIYQCRTLRRRVYGILFNEHHRIFTQVFILMREKKWTCARHWAGSQNAKCIYLKCESIHVY